MTQCVVLSKYIYALATSLLWCVLLFVVRGVDFGGGERGHCFYNIDQTLTRNGEKKDVPYGGMF